MIPRSNNKLRVAVSLLVLVALAAITSACAVLLGLDPLDPYRDTSEAGTNGEGGPNNTQDGGDDDLLEAATPGGEGGTIGQVGNTGCDVNEVLDGGPSEIVFVTPRPQDAGSAQGTGAPADPFLGINAALPRIKLSRPRVILDEGTYVEEVSLTNIQGEVEFDGAWTNIGGNWRRDCSPDRASKTILQSTTAVGLRIEQSASQEGTLAISNVLVRPSATAQPAPNAPGQSRYGVWAVNALLRLTNVIIDVPGATAGGVASNGLGGNPPSCMTTTSCGAGGNSANGPAGAPGAKGSFTAALGFVPGDGAIGPALGNPGANGAPGGAGDQRTNCGDGCNDRCDPNPTTTKTGGTGLCGCGGGGGTPGGAGRGGGASIAIFATGNTLIDIAGSELIAGNGGAGSTGGLGGAGADGTEGAKGEDVLCWPQRCCETCTNPDGTTCGCFKPGNWNALCGETPSPISVATGGSPGGTGQKGGRGSNGGGGAGGPSYVYVTLDTASIAFSSSASSKRTFGTGGIGAGGAPGGPTGEKP